MNCLEVLVNVIEKAKKSFEEPQIVIESEERLIH